MQIDGRIDPKFARLRDAFQSCFADGYEHGASVAVMVDGKMVADLWGGHADKARTKPWREDTLVNVWSATKGVMALAIAMLVERGKLKYEAPVARIWPEFAANGKEAITLDQVMSHQSGLNGIDIPLTEAEFYAWFPYVNALAAMKPLWEPGTHCVYHALSYGHLTGEPIRRVDGRMPGRFVAEEIAGPLGVPFYIGLPESEDHRVAEMIAGPKCSDWVDYVANGPFPHSCRNPTPDALAPNQRAWRAAEVPGGNGQATAGALARIYGLLAKGGTLEGKNLISPAGITAATAPRFRGRDDSFDSPTAFAAGFAIESLGYAPKASQKSFGHTGWGGTIAFADPEAGIGFAFATCHMLGFDDDVDPRRQRLINTVYDCL